ncbi:MAG TPA: flagellar hook capping FlgD N-terminal domain-containing protein [Pirellulaceae bacterium]|nr:flagellar hook capping FlgD N-terminal domain-containing protein [Pirellulaceae bacterium]
MAGVGGVGTSGTGFNASDSKTKGNSLEDLDVAQFLNLMIAELQNQDPLNPMDNTQMLQQIGQLRQITSNDKLSGTLDSVLTGQNLATASGLIGKEVKALTDDAQDITGVIDRVSVQTSEDKSQRKLRVHIGDKSIDVNNIREILPT